MNKPVYELHVIDAPEHNLKFLVKITDKGTEVTVLLEGAAKAVWFSKADAAE